MQHSRKQILQKMILVVLLCSEQHLFAGGTVSSTINALEYAKAKRPLKFEVFVAPTLDGSVKAGVTFRPQGKRVGITARVTDPNDELNPNANVLPVTGGFIAGQGPFIGLDGNSKPVHDLYGLMKACGVNGDVERKRADRFVRERNRQAEATSKWECEYNGIPYVAPTPMEKFQQELIDGKSLLREWNSVAAGNFFHENSPYVMNALGLQRGQDGTYRFR